MRLKIIRCGTGWNVVDRNGNVVWGHESWLACVAFMRGYDTALQVDSGAA